MSMTCKQCHKRPVTKFPRLGICQPCYFKRVRARETRICKIDGCNKKWYTADFCTSHYRRWKQHGDPLWQAPPKPPKPPIPPKECIFPGCDVIANGPNGGARGLCKVHYNRWTAGIQMDLPITPGKCGRKPYVPGISENVRRAASRASYAYAKGQKPTPEDRALHTEYGRLVKNWRRSKRSWRSKWLNAAQ